MKQLNREVWAGLSSAAVVFLIVACGTTPTPSSGCSTDADCGTGKMCHPLLKSCLATCTGSVDCPSSAKTCATFAGAAASDGGALAFCQCSTDALCGASQVCQDTSSKICTAKCAADADCGTGVKCNTTTGKCGGASSTDAGTKTDAGTATDAGVTCNSSNEPDVCGYGNVCTSTNSCEALADGTCANVTAAKDPTDTSANPRARPTWTPANGTGPVVYNIVDEATNDNGACGGGAADHPATVTVYAYAQSGFTFPAQRSALPGFWYFNSNGKPIDVTANFDPTDTKKGYTVSSDGKNASIRLTLCGSAVNPLPAAFGFTNGNAECVSIAH